MTQPRPRYLLYLLNENRRSGWPLTNEKTYRLLALHAVFTPQVKARAFRELCEDHGIPPAHQRQVLYEGHADDAVHPSPEEVYARVKNVFRNLPRDGLQEHSLRREGAIQKQLGMHHGSLRVELNSLIHHHMVCSHCKGITDIEEGRIWVSFRHCRTCPEAFRWNATRLTSLESVPRARKRNAAKPAHQTDGLPGCYRRRWRNRNEASSTSRSKKNTTPQGENNGQRIDRIPARAKSNRTRKLRAKRSAHLIIPQRQRRIWQRRAPPARRQSATGGPIICSSICCTSTRDCRTPWKRSLTMPKSSRNWTTGS